MKRVLLVVLIFFTFTSWAQEHTVGMYHGINGAYISDQNVFSEKFRRVGYLTGIQYKVRFRKVRYGAELSYIQRGFSILVSPYADTTVKNKNTVYKDYQYDYVAIPLNVSFRGQKKVFGSIGLSLVPSFLIDSKTYVAGTLISPNTSEEPSHFDLGGQLEIGGGLKIKENWALLGTLGFFRSFTTINNDNYFPGSNFRNTGVSIGISVEYIFKRKP